jgi:hypothetical protein
VRRPKVPDTQHDEHQRHRELERQAKPRRYHESEEKNRAADQHDGSGVAGSPERTDACRSRDRSVLADDRHDGQDVVGIGGVPHPEEKPKGEDGEAREHGRPESAGTCRRRGGNLTRADPDRI